MLTYPRAAFDTNDASTEIIPAVEGKRIYIVRMTMRVGGAVTAKLQGKVGVASPVDVSAAYPLTTQWNIENGSQVGWYFTEPGAALLLNLSDTEQATGEIWYVQE